MGATVIASDGTNSYVVADNENVAADETAVTANPVDTHTSHDPKAGQFRGQGLDVTDSWNGGRRWGNDGENTSSS